VLYLQDGEGNVINNEDNKNNKGNHDQCQSCLSAHPCQTTCLGTMIFNGIGFPCMIVAGILAAGMQGNDEEGLQATMMMTKRQAWPGEGSA
jgi:hypothetical protein